MDLVQSMLEKKVWAVVGASSDPEKYGYKIYKKLQEHGYDVYPVNPGYTEIDGSKCYPTLESLPEKPEVVDMVVNPKIGLKVIEEAAALEIKNIWFQPGTTNDTILKSTDEKGLQFVQNCVLVVLG